MLALRWVDRPGSRWHVGHDDHDCSVIRGTEGVGSDLSAGAAKGAQVANAAALVGPRPSEQEQQA